MGSNPIWGSDFFRVYVSPRIYVISCSSCVATRIRNFRAFFRLDTSMHFMHSDGGKYIKLMIVLIFLSEQLLDLGHGKLGKGMESHGILKASKSINPEQGRLLTGIKDPYLCLNICSQWDEKFLQKLFCLAKLMCKKTALKPHPPLPINSGLKDLATYYVL